MIKTTFDIGEVADAVSFWIPGFRCGDSQHGVTTGERADYRLRCTRNELIEDFVHRHGGGGEKCSAKKG